MNLFNDLDGKERMTSEALRYLFNRRIEFKTAFLSLLSDKFVYEFSGTNWKCEKEIYFKLKNGDRKRMDLCIHSDNKIGIFIENKIWHTFSENQLDGYKELCENKEHKFERKFFLLIHPEVRREFKNNQSNSTKVDIAEIYWEAIEDIIKTSMPDSNYSKDAVDNSVAWMLKDFIENKIRKYSSFINSKKELERKITPSFNENTKPVQWNFIETVKDRLRKIKQKQNIKCNISKSTGDDYHGIYIKPEDSNEDKWIWAGLSSRQSGGEKCELIYQYPKSKISMGSHIFGKPYPNNYDDEKANNNCFKTCIDNCLELPEIIAFCEELMGIYKTLENKK